MGQICQISLSNVSVFAMSERLISSMRSVTLHISVNVTKHARHSLNPEVDNMVILMKIQQ